MAKIADTIFDTGPKDDLVTVDVYKDTGTVSNAEAIRRQRQLQDSGVVRESFSTELVEGARNLGIDSNRVRRSIRDGVAKSDGSITDRLKAATGADKSPSDALTPEMKGIIADKLSANAYVDRDLVLAVIDGRQRSVEPDDLDDVKGVANFLNELSGNEELAQILDLEAEIAIFDTVLSKAIDLGIPDAIDTLITQSKDKRSIKRVLENNLGRLARASDLAGVRRVVNEIGRETALVREPRLIQTLLTFYQFPDNTTKAQYPERLQELKDTLNLVDPDWDIYVRNGEAIQSLEPFSYASQNALTLFTLDADYRAVALIAPSYPSQHLLAIARDNYPMTALR